MASKPGQAQRTPQGEAQPRSARGKSPARRGRASKSPHLAARSSHTAESGEINREGNRNVSSSLSACTNCEGVCAVCQGEWEGHDKVRVLPCGHQFHKSCVDRWLSKYKACCPLCKADIRPSWLGRIGTCMLATSIEAARIVALLLIVYAVYTNLKEPQNCLELKSAAKNGDIAAVKHALDRGVRAHCRDYWDKKTPLHWAAIMGHEAMTRALVDGGAYLNAKDMSQATPLHNAAMMGHETVMRALVEGGADMNAKDNSYFTPLHIAAMMGHEAVTRTLVEGGADLNAKDEDPRRSAVRIFGWLPLHVAIGWTPLHFAAIMGHEAVTRVLVEGGADLNCKDYLLQRTPLHIAAMKGHEAVTRALVEGGADVNAKGYLSRAATPLDIAFFKGHEAMMRALVKGGADLNSKDYLAQYTPQYTLHWAAIMGHEDETRALVDGDHKSYFTPLHIAAMMGHEAVTRTLVEGGADLNAKDEDPRRSAVRIFGWIPLHVAIGWTPLHIAAIMGHEAVTRVLVEGGADLNCKDYLLQRTPLHIAAMKGHEAVTRALVEGGADLNCKDYLLQRTPLHIAAMKGHEAVTRALVEGGADLNCKDYLLQRTPLHIAAIQGHEAVTRALVEGGSDVNAKGYLSRATPLDIAFFKGHEAMMRALVKGGADLNSKDYLAQYTPQYTLHWAVISIIHGGETVARDLADLMEADLMTFFERRSG
jgi:ankyrin repeat protein